MKHKKKTSSRFLISNRKLMFTLPVIIFGVLFFSFYYVFFSSSSSTFKPAVFPPFERVTKLHVDYIPERNGQGYRICAIVGAFTSHGGIEMWLLSVMSLFQQENEEYDNLIFYGIYVWDLKIKNTASFLRDINLYMFHSVDELYTKCHIVLNTAFHSLESDFIYDILVVHGSATSDWTKRYAKRSKNYHSIVGVSDDAQDSVGEADRNKVLTIPTPVYKREKCQNDIETYRYCSKQMIFVGRISPEKRPKLFCEMLCKNKDWCGIVIGPAYFASNKFNCKCKNVFYLGSRDSNEVQCFMRKSDFCFVPSVDEGGPIVAIEAWVNKLPVVMKKTGLAVAYPDSFIIYDWDTADLEELRNIVSLKHEELKYVALESYKKHFSPSVVKEKWSRIFKNAIGYLSNKGILMWEVTASKTGQYKRLGKSVIMNCMYEECQFFIHFDSSLSCERKCFVLNTYSTIKEVNIKHEERDISVETNGARRYFCVNSISNIVELYFKSTSIQVTDVYCDENFK